MRNIGSTIFAVCLLSIATQASAETFAVDGVDVELPVLDGQCYLTPDHDVDALLLDTMQEMQAGYNRVVGMAYPCAEIPALRNGTLASNYGLWLLNAPKGRVARVPKSYTRKQVLDQLSASLPRLRKDQIESSAQDAVRSQGVDVSIKKLRFLERNGDAVFAAVRVEPVIPGREKYDLAVVYGITMIKGRIFSFNLYRPFDGSSTYDDLLDQVKDVMAEAVAAN